MYKKIVKKLLEKADLKLGKDMTINDKSVYRRLVSGGSLALGESYMDGSWDSENLDELIAKLLDNGNFLHNLMGVGVNISLWLKSVLQNMQTRTHAPELYETHYNAGNYLFESFLDPNMIYTCAYFQNTDDLEQAQLDKIKIIGEKLKLESGDKVLDIGCGWGGTARILSDMFDVDVTGVADTPKQIEYANKHNSGDKVKFIQSDYRDIRNQKFNKIYNIGFLEAVGPKNFKPFMKQVDNLLEDDGIFLTHTIGGHKSATSTDSWIDKYIFPNGVIPSKKQIRNAVNGIFEERDFEAFGEYYATTLKKWTERLNTNWHKIRDKFENPESFKRMMNYYLLASKASFDVGKNDLWQFVFTKPGRVKSYTPYRLPSRPTPF